MRQRKAFTLIELLVTLAIIGILVALLLPAVQAAREAARRASCKNNLHQIGLALHAYHDALRSLPVGCLEWCATPFQTTRRQFAWSALLLPFLEQQPLHAQIDFRYPFDAPQNRPAAATRLSTYECPTAPGRELPRAQTDYGGLFGEIINDRKQDDGVFLYESSVAFAEICDGLTNTFAVAEDVGGPDSEWINGRNVFVQANGVNDPAAWIGDNEIRSKHRGGAMVLACDGAVHFVSETIPLDLLGALITRANAEVVELPH